MLQALVGALSEQAGQSLCPYAAHSPRPWADLTINRQTDKNISNSALVKGIMKSLFQEVPSELRPECLTDDDRPIWGTRIWLEGGLQGTQKDSVLSW